MTLPLVLFLVAAVLPVFFGQLHAAPFWLVVQALALGWVGVLHHGAGAGHTLWALAEVLLLRAVIAPLWLRRALQRRAEPAGDLMPSNLFTWAIAAALIVLAFEFGAPALDDRQALTLGTVAATVVVALLLLSTNEAPPAQLVALLFMENAIALFESLLPEPWPLPVHVALSAVYLLTVGVGGWLIGLPGPARAVPPRRGAWAGPALVAAAVLALAFWSAVFARTPLAEMPMVFGQGLFVLDATSMLFLLVINSVFLGISVYMASRIGSSQVLAEKLLPRAGLTLLFMLAMNLGVLANNLLLLWAFIELTTLCAAPLVAQGDSARPGRVAWRYLLYSSISLAFTLLGILCLTRSAHLQGLAVDFAFDQMAVSVSSVGDSWQRLGLALMLFGLGSKLGLAPLYGWLPETYEAAPTSTSALLAAVQFNISVVAVLRLLQVFRGQDTGFVLHELMIMGCLSLTVAAVQVMAARNYKRLIAYACVSSSGVIAIGLSVGKAAAYGVLLYVVSAAFVKALLFLTAGRLRAVYGTNESAALAGVVRVLPFSGALFAVGIFALLGFPPFGSFMAEMLILSGIVQAGNLPVFTLMCTMLTIIFVATGRSIFPMLWGTPERLRPPVRETAVTALPKLGFVTVLVLLGVYTPAPINELLVQVAMSIGDR